MALLAGHSGNWIAQELRAEGVAVEVVEGPGESRVSLSVAPHGGGALTEFYEPAPEVDEGVWAALELAVERAARDARWVAVSGSLPPGAPDEAYRRLADAARRAGARVALDARDDGLAAGLRARPDFVKVNAARRPSSASPARPSCAPPRAAARSCAALTHGADGMELALPDGTRAAHDAARVRRLPGRQRRRRARRLPHRAGHRRHLGGGAVDGRRARRRRTPSSPAPAGSTALAPTSSRWPCAPLEPSA